MELCYFTFKIVQLIFEQILSDDNAAYGDKYYKLTSDIDLGELSDGVGWTIIGQYKGEYVTRTLFTDVTAPFSGTFDGDGHIVANVSSDRYIFGYISGGTVKNVETSVGGIARRLENGVILDCRVTGTVTRDDEVRNGARADIGGVAITVGRGGIVRNCSSSGEVTSDGSVGGIACRVENGGIVENCDSSAIVKSEEREAGGVAGYVYLGTIRNCSNTGVVSGDEQIGGVVGQVVGGVIENCYSDGAIYGSYFVGGVVGWIQYAPYAPGGAVRGYVRDCYSTGPVRGCSSVGGVAGYVNKATIWNCRSESLISVVGRSQDVEWIAAVSSVGGVAGYVDEGEIESCHSTGPVIALSVGVGKVTGVGGVVGKLNGGSVRDSYSSGSVMGGNGVGGVSGHNIRGGIQNCYSMGPVYGALYVGGVAGWLEGRGIENCYSAGGVTGVGGDSSYIGGIAGNVKKGASIESCYSVGAVSGGSHVGGVAGIISDYTVVADCAALNPSVSGKRGVNRVIGTAYGSDYTISGNVAFSGMRNERNAQGWARASRRLDTLNGADRNRRDLRRASGFPRNFSRGEWNRYGFGETTKFWEYSANKLPMLKDSFGGKTLPGPNRGVMPPHLAGER